MFSDFRCHQTVNVSMDCVMKELMVMENVIVSMVGKDSSAISVSIIVSLYHK